MKEKFGESFKEIKTSIFILSIIFGISSWVVFSGVWVEAPLLLKTLPEGWKIPSLIGAVSQLAQIGPILLIFAKCKCLSCLKTEKIRSLRKHAISDRIIVYFLFAIGLSAGALLALFWDQTMFIFGQNRSVAFFSCVFCLAILDCTCTIVFLTYIGDFKGNYITALYIGEGISSLLPSLFALMQGTGDYGDSHPKCNMTMNSSNYSTNYSTLLVDDEIIPPRFSVSVYFWLLFATLLVSFLAFLALDLWPGFKNDKIDHKKERYEDELSTTRLPEHPEHHEQSSSLLHKHHSITEGPINKGQMIDKIMLLIGITIVSFTLYGFIPGLASYSGLPYSDHIMHLCVTLALITQPFSSLLATFIQVKSTKLLMLILLITMLISSYILVASFMSPCPPLKNHWAGGYIMVSTWIVSYSLLMYLRCCITSNLKKDHGEKTLVWCGLLSQLGQFMGSILIYILVNWFVLFKEADQCNLNECAIN